MNALICVALLGLTFSTTQATTPAGSMNYLRKYGHAPAPDPRKGNIMSLETLQESVMSFQRFAGLEMTGELDELTRAKMDEPRCGNPDVVGTDSNRKRRYALQGSKWPKTSLTYKFENHSPDLSPAETETEIREAFQWWARNSKLTFRQVAKHQKADIAIKFASGAHGDGDPFDGPGQTLAHAYFPQFGGDAHFDESEVWSTTSARGKVNLRIVGAHEIGHSLGLSHSDVQDALMAPFYNPRSKGLHSDDIEAIQKLYGESVVRPGLSTTTRKPRPTTTTKRPVYTRATKPPRTTTTKPPTIGSCSGRFDAITQLKNGSTYAFLADQFWRLNNEAMDEGYPQKTEAVWGISGKIDAALTFHDYTDIFQGHNVYRFQNARLLHGYPLHIRTLYRDIPSNLDAAFEWSGNGKIYFMKGDKYWRYNVHARRSDPGYPKSISVWRGLPGKVDAALKWGTRTYFFSDGMYYRFDDERIQVEQVREYPFPRRADEWWLGCKDNSLMYSNEGQRQGPGEQDDGGNAGSAASSSKFLLTCLVSAVMAFYSVAL